MSVSVSLYGKKDGELNRFLSNFYNTYFDLKDSSNWQKNYANPVELAEIIGTYIDNCDNYSLSMWLCLDKDIYIHINEENADSIIKYLFERYPY